MFPSIIFYIIFIQLSIYMYLHRYHIFFLYDFIECASDFYNQINPDLNDE